MVPIRQQKLAYFDRHYVCTLPFLLERRLDPRISNAKPELVVAFLHVLDRLLVLVLGVGGVNAVLEGEPDVLDLLLDQFLLLFLHIHLLLPVVCEAEVVEVLDELLGDVLEPLEASGQQEEGLDVVVAPGGYGPLQGGDLLLYAALVVQRQEYQQDHFGLSGAWTPVLVLFDLGKDLGFVGLPVNT